MTRAKARAINADRPLRIAFAFLVAAAAIVWAAQSAAVAASPSWQVSEIEGRAWINHGDDGWRALKPGERLAPGDRVETGMNGHIVLSRQKDLLTVWANSRFRLPTPDQLGPAAHVMQTLGTLQFLIATRTEDVFRVRTPFLAAATPASAGSEFTVYVDNGKTALRVSGGALEAISTLSGESATLNSGGSATVEPRTGGRMDLTNGGGRKFPAAQPAAPVQSPAEHERVAPGESEDGKARLARRIHDSLHAGAIGKLALFHRLVTE